MYRLGVSLEKPTFCPEGDLNEMTTVFMLVFVYNRKLRFFVTLLLTLFVKNGQFVCRHGKVTTHTHTHYMDIWQILQQQLFSGWRWLGNPNVCPLCSGGFMPQVQGGCPTTSTRPTTRTILEANLPAAAMDCILESLFIHKPKIDEAYHCPLDDCNCK